jgi:hypothetical protein
MSAAPQAARSESVSALDRVLEFGETGLLVERLENYQRIAEAKQQAVAVGAARPPPLDARCCRHAGPSRHQDEQATPCDVSASCVGSVCDRPGA